jgi:hypothetical protein
MKKEFLSEINLNKLLKWNHFRKKLLKAFQMDKERTPQHLKNPHRKSNFDLIIGECFIKARSEPKPPSTIQRSLYKIVFVSAFEV